MKRLDVLAWLCSLFLSVVMIGGGAYVARGDESGWMLIFFGLAVGYTSCRMALVDLRPNRERKAAASEEMEF